jgi:DNA-binding LacI/PurR family transcriptional regulator
MTAISTTSSWGKSGRIADQLRGRIVKGQWTPGTRLPTRIELEQQFATSAATVQKALDLLKRDQFIVPRGRQGTFVADRLPHRHRIGVVFPVDPDRSPTWSRMYAAIDDEARQMIHSGRRDLRIYYGVKDPESDGHRRLVRDVAQDRLAGVFIVGMGLGVFEHTPVLGHPYLRIAALTSQSRPGVMQVAIGHILPAAVDRLAEAGRRRLALIHSAYQPHLPEQFAALLKTRGLTHHVNWSIPAAPAAPQGARAGAFLLLSQPADRRPDAIIVTDDYLAEQATLGVLDAGVRAPDDVTVVVQCNFPLLPPSVTPVDRMGVDLPALLHAALEALLAPQFDPDSVVVGRIVPEAQWTSNVSAGNGSPRSQSAVLV